MFLLIKVECDYIWRFSSWQQTPMHHYHNLNTRGVKRSNDLSFYFIYGQKMLLIVFLQYVNSITRSNPIFFICFVFVFALGLYLAVLLALYREITFGWIQLLKWVHLQGKHPSPCTIAQSLNSAFFFQDSLRMHTESCWKELQKDSLTLAPSLQEVLLVLFSLTLAKIALSANTWYLQLWS